LCVLDLDLLCPCSASYYVKQLKMFISNNAHSKNFKYVAK